MRKISPKLYQLYLLEESGGHFKLMVDYVVYSTKGEPSTERKIVRILLDRAEVSRYQIEQGLTLYQEKELKEVKRAL